MNKIGTTNSGNVIVEMTLVEWEWLENARRPREADDNLYHRMAEQNEKTLASLMGAAFVGAKPIEEKIPEIIDRAVERAMRRIERRSALVRGRGQSLDDGLPVGEIA